LGRDFVTNAFLVTALAFLVPALVAVPLGALVLRLRGTYFVLVTYVLSQIMQLLLFEGEGLTGGSNGIAGVPPVTLIGVEMMTNRQVLLFACGLPLLTTLITALLTGWFRQHFAAIEENEILWHHGFVGHFDRSAGGRDGPARRRQRCRKVQHDQRDHRPRSSSERVHLVRRQGNRHDSLRPPRAPGDRIFSGGAARIRLAVGDRQRSVWRVWLVACPADRGAGVAVFGVPLLSERAYQPTGELSGGQQQIVTLSRAMASFPRLLLLDEPFLGLAPVWIQQISDAILQLRARGTTVLMTEQMARPALKLATSGYVMRGGDVRRGGTVADIRDLALADEYL
jgi:ABC transporter